MKSIPTVSLQFCEYDKVRKILKLASEFVGMPSKLIVKSHYTGKEMLFVVVGPDDPLFDEDGWDGELCKYRPVDNTKNVDHMYIYHAY